MGSRIFTVIGKQTMSLNLAATGQASFVILGARSWNVADAVSGVMTVRVASTPTFPGGGSGSFTIAMLNSMSMPDDPGTLYNQGTPTGPAASAVAAIVVPSTDGSFPRLYSAPFGPGTGIAICSQVSFVLSGNYVADAGLATITLAVDVLARDG
jgi:hypothetical protein